MAKRWFLVVLASVSWGCVTPPPLAEPVKLQLKGSPGTVSESLYHSQSRTKTYTEGQLIRDRTEIVDFTVRSQIKSVDSDTLRVQVKTVQKDGTVSLHDLAFPELNEQMEYVFRTDGTVLKAGDYPNQSVFYVPSLPLPRNQVQIGETWNLEHTWMSAESSVPLHLKAVVILKDVIPCQEKETCADLEVSGRVEVKGTSHLGLRFESRILARMLFALDRGEVIWSESHSREEVMGRKERVQIASCMVSALKEVTTKLGRPSCTPEGHSLPSVPAVLITKQKT